MDTAYRPIQKKLLPYGEQESHLLLALKGAGMPATQSAMRRITARAQGQGAGWGPPPLRLAPDVDLPDHHAPSPPLTDVFLGALAQSLQAWRTQLAPSSLQPLLLAMVPGPVTMEVQALAFCAPDLLRLTGHSQGSACRLIAPLADVRFICAPQSRAPEATPTCVQFEIGGHVFYV